MNKLETIVFMMAILIVTVMMVNPVVASVDKDDKEEDDPDELFGDEEECAKKFNPEYDRERYLGCTGGIGTPSTR